MTRLCGMRNLAGKFLQLYLVGSLFLFASPLLAQDETPFKIKPQGHEQNKEQAARASHRPADLRASPRRSVSRNPIVAVPRTLR